MIKKLLKGMCVGLAAAGILLGLWLAGRLDTLEYGTWSLRVRAFARPTIATPQIKVILLDQYSLDWGKSESSWSWPWPREVYGAVLDFLKRGGARSVAFDVLYTEPSVYLASDDEALGAGIGRGPPFVGAVFLGSKSGDAETWPEGLPSKAPVFQGLENWLASARTKDVVAPLAAFPIPEVATNVTLLGNVSDQPDEDGVFRRAAMFRVFDGTAVPSLGLAAWFAAADGEAAKVRIEKGWLWIGDTKVPIDDAGRAILHFVGKSGTHETFTAASVIQSELQLQSGEAPTVDPKVFKDAYVLFGFSAPGLMDLRPTPVSKVYPGVEIHATMLDNLLTRLFLRDTPVVVVILATLLLSMLGGIAVTLSRKAWQSVVWFAVFLPVPAALGFFLYGRGYWWPVVVDELAVAVALVGAVVVNYATEGRQKAFIKNAFKFYVGPEVIEQMISDPSRLKLGGEKRELTLFFSDIEKFSSFSERLDPETLTGLLNDYLSEMGDVIKQEGGYLDKYIGDAIVAFWNAPLPQADHAARACRAAIRCQRRLDEKRPEFEARTGAVVKTRIGLNTGEVTVGNMGSRDRFNYTVLGDAANLASRLEGANKAFGTYLMISESTWKQAAGEVIGRELGQLRVVGRKSAVRVYQVMGLRGEPLPAVVEPFERGLALCYAGKWAEALAVFETLPDDAASRTYAGRCRALVKDPEGTWDGIWNLTEK
ncbi:MAG TPA: adenylate/guanylate cyclase domain-containing protein [Kiritimatiellia bacterium]|nr:adenylate/guanylate cyclase domain-containing protein [Kiritimatiellia bacterium]